MLVNPSLPCTSMSCHFNLKPSFFSRFQCTGDHSQARTSVLQEIQECLHQVGCGEGSGYDPRASGRFATPRGADLPEITDADKFQKPQSQRLRG